MKNCLVTTLKGSIQNPDIPFVSRCSFVMRYYENAPQSVYGCEIGVSEPVLLTVENSYFTNSTGTQNYGTSILYSGSEFYIKKPNEENAIVYIDNKFLITSFVAKKSPSTFQTGVNAVDMIYVDTLSDSYEITNIDIGYTSVQWKLFPATTFAKLLKLSDLNLGVGYYANLNFNVNDLALNQINNGRDYLNYPNLKIACNASYVKYYNGSTNVLVPSPTVYIVFKSGGYELHKDTVDGELLYDSTI